MRDGKGTGPLFRRPFAIGISTMPYVLLEHLSRAQLPVDVPAVEDIHKLLALKAAGLVVAEIPAFQHDRKGGSYVAAARVLAVTPAGVTAIKKRRT